MKISFHNTESSQWVKALSGRENDSFLSSISHQGEDSTAFGSSLGKNTNIESMARRGELDPCSK